MSIAAQGRVMLRMSEYLRQRAEYHNAANDGNAALCYSMAFALQVGAEECLAIATEDRDRDSQP